MRAAFSPAWVDRVEEALTGAAVRAPILRYYDDPAGFARDCIDWRGPGLAPYQEEILTAIPRHRRVAARGPHGLGKSTTAAVVVLWFALTREAAGVDWKVVTTAGAWRQLIHYLWPEIRKWSARIRWDIVRPDRPFTAHELLALHLKLGQGEAFAAAASNPALIEGAHADSLLFIYDEAKAISATTFDACEGAFSGTGESYALTLSTPGQPSGRFYDIHARKPGYEDWWARHVTLDEAIAADRISRSWAEQRRRQWGADSALYQNRVLGDFHAGDEDSVVPLAWVEAANARWEAWEDAGRPEPAGARVLGVDVARFGSDKTVIAIRQGHVVQELRESAKADTMKTTGKVVGLLHGRPHARAVVDVIGIGAGVVDRLREQGFTVSAFNAGAGTKRRDRLGELGFVNCLTGDARVAPVGKLRRIYRSRHQGALVQVETAGGDQFTATPNHQVLTPRGWVAVQSLHVGDKLCDAAIRDPADAASVRPEVDHVPATLSEVYGAAERLFGAERVQGRAVDFHGDRPSGDVDVVTVGGDLLTIGPVVGEQVDDLQLLRSLIRPGSLSGLGATRHPGMVGDCTGWDGPVRPGDGVPGAAGSPLLGGEHVVDYGVRGLQRPDCDAVLSQGAGNRSLVHAVMDAERLDGFPGRVAAGDLVGVEDNGPIEPGRAGLVSWLDAVFGQDAANDVPVDPETVAQRVQRIAAGVPADYGAAVDVDGGRLAGRLSLPADRDAATDENLSDRASIGVVARDQRTQRLSAGVPTDEVVRVKVRFPPLHEAPFVYTIESTTGAYSTGHVVHRNCRSAAWWQMREILDPSTNPDICLPPHDELLGDLTTPKWREQSGGKIAVESKDDLRTRIGRSTDYGDAVIQAFEVPSTTGEVRPAVPWKDRRRQREGPVAWGGDRNGGTAVVGWG